MKIRPLYHQEMARHRARTLGSALPLALAILVGCQPPKAPSPLTDDLRATPGDFESLVATAKRKGFLKAPATEYDNACPPDQNFFSFIDKLNAALPGMPAGGRAQPRRALIEGDWDRVEQFLATNQSLLAKFAEAPKLRRGYRAATADPNLDFGRTVRSKGALELLLAAAELDAFRGKDQAAVVRLRQAIAFTNALANQPAPIDYVSGRGAQVTVLVSMNRIASRLRSSPNRLGSYESLVRDWNPTIDRERLIRFEVNSFLKKLFAETEDGVYAAALERWRIRRNASLPSGGDGKPYSQQEEDFVELLTRESMKEKQSLPYSPDRLRKEDSALAVVVAKILQTGLDRLSEAQSPKAAQPAPFGSPPRDEKLSDLFSDLFSGTSLDSPEDLFFTNKALVITAIDLYRNHPKSGFPNGLPSGKSAPKDGLGRPIELVKLPTGLSLRSVGPDGQPDPVGRRNDDRVIRLDYDFKKKG